MPDGPRGQEGATDELFFPIPKSSWQNAGSNNFGQPRTGHIHAGNDMSASCGTPVYAVRSGEIIFAGSMSGYGNYIALKMDDGWVAGYGHLSSISVNKGQRVEGNQKLGAVGNTGFSFGCHLHFNIGKNLATSYSDNIDPMDYLQGAVGPDGSGGGSGGGASTGDLANVEAIAKASAFSTFLALPGILDTAESLALTGERSLMNDQPLLPFIEQLCQASLRNFQSMPNGNFFAFFPDYFGGLNHRTPYWEINDIEIIDGRLDLSDDALATHVYVVGDVSAFDGQIDWKDKIQTGGVVTIYNVFAAQADFLNGVPTMPRKGASEQERKKAQEEYDKLMKNAPRLATKEAATNFIKKYGARPYFEEAPMVRNPYYEAFLAYQRFMLLWSRQFLTTFTVTFMPELFPGGIVAFPDHGIQCYVDEVEHVCSYSDGFVTQVALSAPAALGKNGRKNVHRGMIRANVIGKLGNAN